MTYVTFQDEDVVHDTKRWDCAKIALGQTMLDKKPITSPFRYLVFITVFSALSRDLLLILFTTLLTCFSLWA